MPNGMYGDVRGKKTKVGQKTCVSRPAFPFLRTYRCVAAGLQVRIRAVTGKQPGKYNFVAARMLPWFYSIERNTSE